jgi:hypothetical protein
VIVPADFKKLIIILSGLGLAPWQPSVTAHGSRAVAFSAPAGADQGAQTPASQQTLWAERALGALTFQFLGAGSALQFLVQVTSDVNGDGTAEFRYLTYETAPGVNSTNADHTDNRFYLDPALRDGRWHVFSRDLASDWSSVVEGTSVVKEIQGLGWRGGMSIDNVRLASGVTRRVYTNAPAALGGLISVVEIDPSVGTNRETWLHHDRMGSASLATGASAEPLVAFPATGRVIESCSGSEPDARWLLYAGTIDLAEDEDLAKLAGRGAV